MKAFLGAALFVLAASAVWAQDLPALPQEDFKDLKVECVPASGAMQLVGQQGCVAGRIYRATVSRNGNQHLSLCPPRSGCSFHVVVARRDRAQVGDITHLKGKLVAFDGGVSLYRGQPRIVVRAREQIHVTAGSTPTEFDAEQGKPSTKGLPRTKRNF